MAGRENSGESAIGKIPAVAVGGECGGGRGEKSAEGALWDFIIDCILIKVSV